jgi:transcriptional regulator with XRE-family HTH domain
MTMQQRTAKKGSATPLRSEGSTTTLRLRALVEKQQRLEIGQRIRELREASPETNRSIADYVGVGERSVANWIAGQTGITYEHAKKVASLFNVDVRWLWDGQERPAVPDLMGTLNNGTELSELRGMVMESLQANSEQLAQLLATVASLETQVQGLGRELRDLREASDG